MQFKNIIFHFLFFQFSCEVRFDRRIIAVKFPFYKILMTLGQCNDVLLFSEQQIWKGVKLNRILDISYKSDNPIYKVTKVEIRLVVNNTEFFTNADDVGSAEFRASIIFPTKTGITFYRLDIYSCKSIDLNEKEQMQKFQGLPFYVSTEKYVEDYDIYDDEK